MYEELIKQLRADEIPLDELIRTMREAADTIEELQRQIDAWVEPERKALIKSLPKWIPVTERLPDKYHQVLVYGLNGMQIDYYAGEKSIGGHPLFMISEAKVTHWQPLPEPPKEGK